MASPDINSLPACCTGEILDGSFSINIHEGNPANFLLEPDVLPTSSLYRNNNIPNPPPFPRKSIKRGNYYYRKLLNGYGVVPKETQLTWDRLFKEGHEPDVHIVTEEESIIPAHSVVLSTASTLLGNLLQQSKVRNGRRYINFQGVPSEAVYTFTRFLYSSCYDEEEMKKYVLHLLVLSHSYSVPSLKRACTYYLEQGWLNTENVIDVLLLARNCDASRLSFICARMAVKNFKVVSSTEGWKVMRRANPILEQELLEYVVEAESRKEERLRKKEEKKVYLRLNEAMEALVHICRDGCRTIGPRDKMLKGRQAACEFPACKGVESLVRHFFVCKIRVPGGCGQCKRMWQILELHSRTCEETGFCKVPLCRHFKERVDLMHSRKEAIKWRLLVSKVIAAKNALSPFSSRCRTSCQYY